ncbi:histidine phosphotransferase family protein [Sulfitobacter sp. F26169L]|uniref:histidine phosphotransferase family protein n=1 Tax=Sulfitobacter sp. F26169L TaxID=2996015 RepID=UPI002260BEF5|nr:histidine phosphotransferase family protein [Sulfitobacter sp. F26169L]MCX7565482.1 histidine phosphotransferase family protein [Sulfitobacter sp. F26169L]
MGQNTNLAALIGSRICHDLISPIGAINNGLELMEMSMPSVGPEMALVSESVMNASARIRFFRIAFGAAGTQLVGRPEVVSILNDVYATSRLTVVWGPLEGQQRRMVRLTFLALMCMESGMPYGGRIEVSQDGDHLLLTGHADKLNIDADLWGLLNGAPREEELRPAQVQFALLPLIAEDEERRLDVDVSGDSITIRI